MAACDTAGDNAETTESLGGVARAFFFAGARSMLVSHWEVDSRAAVPLMIGMAMRDSNGRAEALRASQIAMIDHGEPRQAHPSYWSPFVLVGEGGTAK
jgi:CHAT domain-containing protein